MITGNFIGTTDDGNGAIGNAGNGVNIFSGGSGNLVGGLEQEQGDWISGNQSSGVVISGDGTSENVLESDTIGTDFFGFHAIPNNGQGVLIDGGASDNSIGAVTAYPNLISGNNGDGIDLQDSGTSNNVVVHDLIGVARSSAVAVANMGTGVNISNGASNNTIGGSNLMPDINTISGNQLSGISIAGEGSTENMVAANYIGTDDGGSIAVANNVDGISLSAGASNNTIGGAGQAQNLISGNNGDGIDILGSDTSNNLIVNDFIGTTKDGTSPLPNTSIGVKIGTGASSNTIGGKTSDDGNVISGNQSSGIEISDSGTSSNLVEGNWIGTDITGSKAIGNTNQGILIGSDASGNTVGGVADAQNVISGNHGDGVDIENSGTTGNVIAGNVIGTTTSGNTALANTNVGVGISDGASDNTIGGSTTDDINVISGNQAAGISISGAARPETLSKEIGLALTPRDRLRLQTAIKAC